MTIEEGRKIKSILTLSDKKGSTVIDLINHTVGLQLELDEMNASFQLRWKADMRAIKRWQKATGKTMTWPDHVDLVCWLMKQLEAKEPKKAKKRKGKRI